MVMPIRFNFRVLLLILVLTAGLAAMLWWFFFRDSEEVRIRARLTAAARLVSFDSGESDSIITSLTSSHDLADFLTDDIRISVPGWNMDAVFPRDEIVRRYFATRRVFRALGVSFRDLSITVNHDEADVSFTAIVSGQPRAGGGRDFLEVRICESVFRRVKGEWRAAKIKLSPVVER